MYVHSYVGERGGGLGWGEKGWLQGAGKGRGKKKGGRLAGAPVDSGYGPAASAACGGLDRVGHLSEGGNTSSRE